MELSFIILIFVFNHETKHIMGLIIKVFLSIRIIVMLGILAFALFIGIVVTFNGLTAPNGEFNIVLKIIITFIMVILMLVLTRMIILYIKHSLKKCGECGNRFSFHKMGGTKYYQFECTDCGEKRWEQHT